MASQAQSLRQDEKPEYPFVGPFGGIQSEMAIDQIGRTGFQEVQNLIFRKAQARLVPGFSAITSPNGAEVIMGIGDFFNVNGVRLPVVWTPTKMYFWNGTAWTQVTGALTGTTSQFFQWDVVGYKIYFSQQKDIVQVWDGITAGFGNASASAVPAKYLMELNFQLLAANCIVAGPVNAPNRIFWTGPGAGTDWTSFVAGQTDLFNGLGPINGLAKLYQAGYAFQQWGVVQIVPTGIGLAPFQFITMGSKAKGSILPYGIASFGENIACYIGKDNVYSFDGTQSYPIGSRPIDGNRMLGARSRIFVDLASALFSNIFGFILSSANGYDYDSYWLFIPSLNKAWVYHFDEGSWTQVFFNVNQLQGPVGVFANLMAPRIEDLIGTISAQTWTPATLISSNPLDTMAISDANAFSISQMAFNTPSSFPTSGSINTGDGWYLKTGALHFDDPRHEHTVRRVRLLLVDYGNVTINMRWTNELGVQSPVKTLTYGTGSGATLTFIIEVPQSLHGRFLTLELSGPQGTISGFTEITPLYDVGSEGRCN